MEDSWIENSLSFLSGRSVGLAKVSKYVRTVFHQIRLHGGSFDISVARWIAVMMPLKYVS